MIRIAVRVDKDINCFATSEDLPDVAQHIILVVLGQIAVYDKTCAVWVKQNCHVATAHA